MIGFLARRLAFGVLVVWLVATAVFVMFFVGPSDPANALCGPKCTETQVEQTRIRNGLDEPLATQYVRHLGNVARFDFGRSAKYDTPVRERLVEAVAPTASLVVGAAVLWVLVGVSAGVVAARRPGSWRDRGITLGALLGISVPPFVVGMLLLYLFAHVPAQLGYVGLPPSSYVPLTGPDGDPGGWLSHLILPWASLAIVAGGVYARLTRTAMLTALGEDFIRTARAKGLSERRVAWRHAFPAAAPGVLTVLGVDIGTLLGGAVVIEPMFNLHGLGQEVVGALQSQDLPVIMGVVVVGTVAVVVVSALVDVVHAWLDPRVALS